MVLEHFGDGPSCRSDGTEGTVKVVWYNGEEEIATTEGCIVKNDDNFRDLLGVEDKKPNYFAYTYFASVCVDLWNDTSSKAIIHVYTDPPNKLNDCTVNNIKNKKKDVQEYTFVPCEDESFNNSLFLKKHSKSIKALDASELCENRIQRVLALAKRERPDGSLNFLKSKIEKNNGDNSFYIRKKFDKLEDTSPLFLTTRTSTLFNCCCCCCYKKTTTLVGYYKRCEDKIAIYAFNTSTEPIVVYRSHEAARKASMSGNAVDAPGSPVVGPENSPSQPATNSRQMAAGGRIDPVENTHSPTQEQGESPGRNRENSSLAIGSSRRNDQPKLPPGYKLEDIIDKDDMRYKRYLLHIAETLTNDDWKRLGESLKIPYSDLERIENDYSEQVKERAYQMLIKWTEYTLKPTLKILIDALNETAKLPLVDEISDFLGDNIKQMEGGTPARLFDLRDIISEIQDDWKFIGRYLGLKESAIRGIRGSYGNRVLYERAHQMLIKWQNVKGKAATVQVLMVALDSVGRKNVVKKLVKKLEGKKAKSPA